MLARNRHSTEGTPVSIESVQCTYMCCFVHQKLVVSIHLQPYASVLGSALAVGKDFVSSLRAQKHCRNDSAEMAMQGQ